jgi:hypothetical protein
MLIVLLVGVDLVGLAWLFATLSRHPAPVVHPMSLRAKARALLVADRRRDRVIRRWREMQQRFPVLRVLPFTLIVAGVFATDLLPFLPSPGGTFSDEAKSADFLGTLWQVVAGALGLSVAMIAFAFEAFMSISQRRLGGNLREFAAETWLVFAIQLGVLSLLIDGMVLLGIGAGAPGGWAGMWATLLSAATLAGVAYVLTRVVKSLDFDELVRIRRVRLEASVEDAMWHQLTGQAAEAVLRGYEQLGIERAWIRKEGGDVVRATRGGELRDVKLGILLRLAVAAQRQNRQPKFELLVGLGERVEPDAELIAIVSTASAFERWRVRRALRLRRAREAPPDRSLNDELARLHGQAMAAVRAGRAEEWRAIGALYELVLLALPRAAKKIGVPFEGAIAAPGFFGFGPLQRIAEHLGDEVEAALDSGDAELVSAIAYVPGAMAQEAMRTDAVQVAVEMIKTYPRMYWLARKETEPRSRAAGLLLDRSTRHLVELDYTVERGLQEAGDDEQRRGEAAQLGRGLFSQINIILKTALDLSDGDVFVELERKWAKMFQDEIVYLYEEPGSEPDMDSLAGLDRYRSVLQLGLAMWAMHLLAQGETDDAGGMRGEALRLLSARLGGVEQLFDSLERAERRDEEESVPWTSWFLGELPEDEAHMIPTSSELLFTTMLLAVERTDLEGESEIRPREWFESRSMEIDGALGQLREEVEQWSGVLESIGGTQRPAGADDRQETWLAKVKRLEAMLNRAREGAIEQRQAEEREATLDPQLVDELRSNFFEATQKNRLVRDLFATQGALEERTDTETVEPRVSRTWLPKRLFIRGSRLIGVDRTGRDLARVSRNEEMNQLHAVLGGVPCEESGDDLGIQLKHRIADLAETGRPATLLLLPVSWKLRESLGLPPMWGQVPFESTLIPANRRAEFAGLFDGVPVLDSPWTPEDRVYLVNLPSVGRFVEWPSENGSGVELELQTFDTSEARAFLADHPEVSEKGASEDEAEKTLQERVLCSQFIQWRLEPSDDLAAHCLIVPEQLRHKGN